MASQTADSCSPPTLKGSISGPSSPWNSDGSCPGLCSRPKINGFSPGPCSPSTLKDSPPAPSPSPTELVLGFVALELELGEGLSNTTSLLTTHLLDQMSSPPTAEDFVEWSKRWAKELALVAFPLHDDSDWFDPSIFSLRTDFNGNAPYAESPDLTAATFWAKQVELRKAEADRVRLLQFHPETRKQANALGDAMLRDAGVSEEVIAMFKQVLPYKMAHLHKIRYPQPGPETIFFWVSKEKLDFLTRDDDYEQMVLVEFNILADWSDVKEKIENYCEPLGGDDDKQWPRRWEYMLIIQSKYEMNGASPSDGALEKPDDYYKMIDTIRDPNIPYTSAIVFQAPRVDPRTWPVALILAGAPIPMFKQDNGVDLGPVDEHGTPYFDPVTFEAIDRAVTETIAENQHLLTTTEDQEALVPTGQQKPPDDEYPLQILAWLKGEDFNDEPFEFPEIPSPRHRQNIKTLWGSRKPEKRFWD